MRYLQSILTSLWFPVCTCAPPTEHCGTKFTKKKTIAEINEHFLLYKLFSTRIDRENTFIWNKHHWSCIVTNKKGEESYVLLVINGRCGGGLENFDISVWENKIKGAASLFSYELFRGNIFKHHNQSKSWLEIIK